MESCKTILTKLFAEYYLSAGQAKQEGKLIAYITAFTPVEILRAMDVVCLYPESYAVVCAASNKAEEMIHASGMESFAQDLCSYSLIDFGTEHHPRLPYGGLPDPDILIATNNQCSTTLLWFRLLAQKKNIPLFIIDYPGTVDNQGQLRRYIRSQYDALIRFVNQHTSTKMDGDKLSECVSQSRKACRLWNSVHELNKQRPISIDVTKIINALFPIVVAKGTQTACDYYQALIRETAGAELESAPETTRLLWHGYPMWFLSKKFPQCFDAQFQIVLNDYTLWWNLDYPEQADDMDALMIAYCNTYLNRSIEDKIDWVCSLAKDYSIDAVICHANRSCRRSLADITPLRDTLAQRDIPSIIIESDMANPSFYSQQQVALRIESFKEMLAVS